MRVLKGEEAVCKGPETEGVQGKQIVGQDWTSVVWEEAAGLESEQPLSIHCRAGLGP